MPDRRPGPRKSRTGTGGPNRTAPDRHGGRTGTGTGPRRTGSGASRRTGPAARRRRPAPMACTAGPKPETASTSTRARTGPAQGVTRGSCCRADWNGDWKPARQTPPGRRPGPPASRAGGVLCARYSLLIAGYIRPPSPHQPAGPGQDRTGGRGPGQTGHAGPQNRARARFNTYAHKRESKPRARP